MAEVVVTKFKTNALRQFVEGELANNDFYFFVSGIERSDANNTFYSTNEFLERTLFGKKVASTDIRYVIKYWPWQEGQLFVQYDDKQNMIDQKFYAVISPQNNNDGNYQIFKCIFNNYGVTVSDAPNYDASNTSQVYTTADGYIWKWMYNLTEQDFEAYNVLGYIPLPASFTVDPAVDTSVGAEISQVFVENKDANEGYELKISTLAAPPIAALSTVTSAENYGMTQVDSAAEGAGALSQIEGFYNGQWFYITSSAGASYLYTVKTYTYHANTGRGRFTFVETEENSGPLEDGVTGQEDCRIMPRIQIDGDGSGARAIPIIQNNTITGTTMIDYGSGYRSAQAKVVDPEFGFDPSLVDSTDVRAEIRPVLTPLGGHGYSLLDEFNCTRVMMYGYVTEDNNNQIGKTNTVSKVGLVTGVEWANSSITLSNTPEIFDNRIAVTTNDYALLSANAVVQQLNSNNDITFEAIVHEVDASANTIYLCNYNNALSDVDTANNLSFDVNSDLRTTTGLLVGINTPRADNIILPDYKQRSGEVYFLEDFIEVERKESSREEFKLVLEF